MRHRHRLLVALIVVTSSTASCLSRGEDPCSEGPGVDGLIASAERWLVLAPSSYDDIDVSGSCPSRPADRYAIAIHPTTVPEVRDALDEGATVFLALSSAGSERELVIYEIARSPAGAHRLLNDACGWTEVLQARLRERFDARMASVIGQTDRGRIEALLGPPSSTS